MKRTSVVQEIWFARPRRGSSFGSFEVFGFWICFGFHASIFEFLRASVAGIERARFVPSLLLLAGFPALAFADGNRLTYLDRHCDPYYVQQRFPKLTTPQWIGDQAVEAAVVLAIDDMRDTRRYEQYLRPILDRLHAIDGQLPANKVQAPLSIMTCRVSPADPQLAKWLAEGVTIEVHSIDHPCPLLRDGDLAKAKSTVDRCIDLLHEIPGNRPVAYRMPCCDSLNTPSPRFFTEIFNQTTPKGHFLHIDTSVFNVTTPQDKSLPRELVLEQGRPRFRKYLPFPSFVNTIDDYPYPYVIGRLCWEFPCMVPSDWEAQNVQQANNPKTVEDLQAALDVAVIKQGVMNLVFHPHGWIRNDQIVQLIDHSVRRHGPKVRFLNFRQALRLLEKNLLAGQSLRTGNGQDNGVRLLDLDNDGFLDVVIGNPSLQCTRLWSPKTKTWNTCSLPIQLVGTSASGANDLGARFCVLREDGNASMIVRNESVAGAWHFDGMQWKEDRQWLQGLEIDGQALMTSKQGKDQGVRFRDLDGDGRCECLLANPRQNAVFAWDSGQQRWTRLRQGLPRGVSLVDDLGRDAGLRFVDVDRNGRDDVLFSNDDRYSLHLFQSLSEGWGRRVFDARRGPGQQREFPRIVSGGRNHGVWFHSGHVWVQNEFTHRLPDLVDRRSFAELLGEGKPSGASTE